MLWLARDYCLILDHIEKNYCPRTHAALLCVRPYPEETWFRAKTPRNLFQQERTEETKFFNSSLYLRYLNVKKSILVRLSPWGACQDALRLCASHIAPHGLYDSKF
jgi:hypothetical protein